MKKFFRKKFLLPLILTLFIIGQTTFLIAEKSNGSEENNIFENIELFTKVLSIVKKDYVDDKSFKELIYGSINGMLSSLDPHSSFMKPDEFKEMQVETTGEFGGLGIEITIKDNILTVVSPIEDTPAYKAGVKPNDKILKINGESTKNMTLTDAVKKLRGKKGSKVTISIFRTGAKKIEDIEIIRDIIKIKSIKSKIYEDGIAYIRLAQFQQKTTEDLKTTLKNISKETGKIKGLVLDMRNNPGGLLTQAADVSDIFLKKGKIVYTSGRIANSKMEFFAHDDGNEGDYPIVVLVNAGSASASEIVAGALQDLKRGIIMGTQTFGKGSVQTIIPLDDGSALRLTTAKYYTPSGRSIQAKGITPDIIVEQQELKTDNDTNNKMFLREEDLQGHFEAITTMEKKKDNSSTKNKGSVTNSSSISKSSEVKDFQLLQALQLLKALQIISHK